MDCQDFRSHLSLYVDDAFETSSTAARAVCDEHLHYCPLCRADVADFRKIKSSLSAIRRPVVSPDFTDSLRRAVNTELVAQQATRKTKLDKNDWRAWFKFNLMPYTVGAVGSALLFLMMFSALYTAMTAFRSLEVRAASVDEETATVIRSETAKIYDTSLPYSPADYAALRSPHAFESPSLNPKGALVSFTSSLMRGEVDQSAVVVVADVFGNGLARVADVLEAPHDPNKLDELEKILNNEPVFVPASYDKRPENLRVVLLIQKVNISGETDRKENQKSKRF
jgi:hypothetical protein